MGETTIQKHLAVQDLTKLKVEELTPLTPEVISRQVRQSPSHWDRSRVSSTLTVSLLHLHRRRSTSARSGMSPTASRRS